MRPQNTQERMIAVKELIPQEVIEQKIFIIRGYKVMLDKDLSVLYGVETRDLNKAVARNLDRFPSDFMFQLTQKEYENLMFQFGTSSWGGTRKLPRVFTEHGILTLSSVLRSRRAIQVNIFIMRAFVKLRQILSTHKELAEKLGLLEQKVGKHDHEIQVVIQAIQKLIEASQVPPKDPPPKRRIGFHQSKYGV